MKMSNKKCYRYENGKFFSFQETWLCLFLNVLHCLQDNKDAYLHMEIIFQDLLKGAKEPSEVRII